ncbi:hypothetical protein AMJ83_02910 [candidate division WOR_3 bacterium SM23_42]|uniref:FlgD/Vpr Ig-like domain-containing protein n=1 Tax=candidate division WOR_3 bacterium SM23_42 TaxID=1703779 RepID=A0A0S8FXH5_UNCW3|nr:MAG: hypothetical protein AMJ83_02910 [candidate division WOR_3 bacterium SM23_42]
MITRLFISAVCIICTAYASIWTETTQEDFADGIFERDIYASHLDSGTVEFAPRFDLNGDGYIDVFTADRYGPYVRIYWGDASGYSPSNVTMFPSSGGANCDAADLDGDGYPEFVVAHYFEKVSIYAGSAAGPNPQSSLDFPMVAYNRQGVFVADFDKDGYLDIATSQEFTPGNGAVLWGSASGYDINNRTDLPVYFGIHNIEVADFNQDTWLDILFIEYYGYDSSPIRIYWGSSNGFIPSNMSVIMGPGGNTGTSIADLDADGWLDVVSTGWYDPQSYIYWGDESGYSPSNMQILDPGYCYGGSSVADMNKDSYLDIIYHRGGYGVAYQKIYWGSASGYSNSNYVDACIPLETSGGLVADLNIDGHLDIFCNTRTPTTHSYVFYGPSFSTCNVLPAIQDHHGVFREIGNVYDRAYCEDYASSILDAYACTDWGTIEWCADTPTGSAVLFWVRSGSTAIPDTTWSDWCSVNNGDSIPDALNARYLQYKAGFTYDNPCYLPSLKEVSITYDGAAQINAVVSIKPETINLGSQGRFTALITLPTGYDHEDIDLSTIGCEGALAVLGSATPEFFIAEFNVQDLSGVMPASAVEFQVTGQLYDGTSFHGYDTVCVIGTDYYIDITCRPNPFSARTVISVTPISEAAISVKIYNIIGELVRTIDEIEYSETHAVAIWNGRDNSGRKVPAGVYLYKVEGEGINKTEKIVVLD